VNEFEIGFELGIFMRLFDIIEVGYSHERFENKFNSIHKGSSINDVTVKIDFSTMDDP
jgi:hypothetical protein